MYAPRHILKDKRISINENTIHQRCEKYEIATNPLKVFSRLVVDKEANESDYITKEDAYQAYQRFCRHYKLAVIDKTLFGKMMKRHWIDGSRIKKVSSSRSSLQDSYFIMYFPMLLLILPP